MSVSFPRAGGFWLFPPVNHPKIYEKGENKCRTLSVLPQLNGAELNVTIATAKTYRLVRSRKTKKVTTIGVFGVLIVNA